MLFIPSIGIYGICFFSFFFSALCICSVMLLMGFVCGGRSLSSHSKNVPFESGVDSLGNARLRFSIKFYLIGMFFVIFDAEALYLYIWSIVICESGWLGLLEIIIFVCVLLMGLMYLMSVDALNWREDYYNRHFKKIKSC